LLPPLSLEGVSPLQKMTGRGVTSQYQSTPLLIVIYSDGEEGVIVAEEVV
jgi:hypothetical protein